MVQKTVQKLTSIESSEEDTIDEDDDEDDDLPVLAASKVKTFANLVSWYENVVMKTPLIVIIQDLESFSTLQLQDFVLLCRYSIIHFSKSNFIESMSTIDLESTVSATSCPSSLSWA